MMNNARHLKLEVQLGCFDDGSIAKIYGAVEGKGSKKEKIDEKRLALKQYKKRIIKKGISKLTSGSALNIRKSVFNINFIDNALCDWLCDWLKKKGIYLESLQIISYQNTKEGTKCYETFEIRIGFWYSQIFSFLEKQLFSKNTDENELEDKEEEKEKTEVDHAVAGEKMKFEGMQKLSRIVLGQALNAVEQEVSDDAKYCLLMHFINALPEEVYGYLKNVLIDKCGLDISIERLHLEADSP